MAVLPDYWRQLDLVSPADLATPVTLIGAGGIGSLTAVALAKLGTPRLTVYDPDTVEPHNLPNQFYRLEDVGRPKVEALAALLGVLSTCDVTAIAEPFTGGGLDGVVIAAVDTMAARAAIWQEGVRYQAGVELYVDGRMGAEVCRILAVRPTDPEDVRRYEATLHGDDEARSDPCTAQAVIYNVLNVAGLIANVVKRHARGEPLRRELIFDFVTLSLLVA